jgi:hypothetical protein
MISQISKTHNLTMSTATFQWNATIVPPVFPDRLLASTPPTALQPHSLVPPAALWGLYHIVMEGKKNTPPTSTMGHDGYHGFVCLKLAWKKLSHRHLLRTFGTGKIELKTASK